jgi:hypothetical protein
MSHRQRIVPKDPGANGITSESTTFVIGKNRFESKSNLALAASIAIFVCSGAAYAFPRAD